MTGKKLKQYAVSATVVGSKFIGYFQAESADEAIALAEKSGNCYVSVCHQCSEEIGGAEADEFYAEEVDDHG